MGRNVGKDAIPTWEGFQKLMWYEIVKEFNGKTVSTWSSCDDEKGESFHALGPKMETCATCVRNEFQLCSTWDHYPVYATIQEDDGQGHFIQQKNKV